MSAPSVSLCLGENMLMQLLGCGLRLLMLLASQMCCHAHPRVLMPAWCQLPSQAAFHKGQ
jgi:hypothetical protein